MNLRTGIIISVFAHIALVGLLVANFQFSKVEVQATGTQQPKINAKAINSKRVEQLVEKLKKERLDKSRKEKKRLEELKKKKEREATRPHVFLAYSAPVHYDSLAICFEVVQASDYDSSCHRSQQHQQQHQQHSTGSFDQVSDQEEDNNDNQNEDSSLVAGDDEVEVLIPHPVSIPQLIAKLTKEFAQEEDQWVDLE